MVIVESRKKLIRYCASKGITLSLFNEPVEIPEGVTDCESLFEGASSFNQPVKIPSTCWNMKNMFKGWLVTSLVVMQLYLLESFSKLILDFC